MQPYMGHVSTTLWFHCDNSSFKLFQLFCMIYLLDLKTLNHNKNNNQQQNSTQKPCTVIILELKASLNLWLSKL